MTTAAVKRPFPPGMPITPGQVISGKYRIDELVAIGGMGIVVAAYHLQLGQQVAIKVLLPSEMSDETQAIPRFLREARAAAGIRSEHVVRIYDVDTMPDGLPYIVMELLEGVDLRRVVKTHGALPIEQAVDFVLQAADALEEAHRLGIVHRDIKPSNLFLTRRKDGRPLVKVLDFGISKASTDQIDGTLTTSRAMIGSPMYMSPEQVRDAKSVDLRSDIWSLGVILYELLAGKPAFKGDSLPAICAAIAADPPPGLREIRPDVSVELEDIIFTCLAKNPGDRYPNVDAFTQALEPFLPHDMPYMSTMPAPSDGQNVGFQFPSSGRVPRSVRPSLHSSPGVTTRQSPLSVRPDQDADPHAPHGPASSRFAQTGPKSARLLASSPGSSASPLSRSTPASRAGVPLAGDSSDSLPTARYDHIAPASLASSGEKSGLLVEAGVSDSPIARSAITYRSAPKKSKLPLIIVAVLLFVSLAVASIFAFRPKAPDPSVAAAAAKPKTFILRIESTPSGAEVFENDRALGTTPLEVTIERESVTGRSRELSLRLPGYKSRTITQGSSETDVRVQAELLPETPTAVVEPTVPPPAPRGAPWTRSSRQPAPKPSARPAGTPGTDIKLHR